MRELNTTLLLIIKDKKILLARKKRGQGVGKLNGVGGKIEHDETIEQAMIRECQEEIEVTPKDFKKMGVLHFNEYFKGEKMLVVTHVYIANDFDGVPRETEEMIPYWYDLEKVPYNEMYEDDKEWLPLVLEGLFVDGVFNFDVDFKLISHSITIKKQDS